MKILLVDDSSLMREMIKRRLQGLRPTWTFLEANNGRVALESVVVYRPDFIITDANMPEMGGIEMIQTLRGIGNETPVGFLTSQASPKFIQSAQQQGVVFTYSKPFNPQQVILAIEMAVL